MKARCFDALVNFPPGQKQHPCNVFLQVNSKKISAALHFYERIEGERGDEFIVRVCPSQSISLKWRDKFKVKEEKERGLLGQGIVLNPLSLKVSGKKIKKSLNFLQLLRGGEKEMLLALVEEKGIQGLRQSEIFNFCRLSENFIICLCQELEEQSEIRILSFSPLFLLRQQSLDFLSKKIVAYLEQYHNKHPEEIGVSQERIKERYGLHRKILTLSLKHLEKQGQIRMGGNLVALSTFKTTPTPEEEAILRELEEMCFRGEFQSVSLRDIQQQFHLSSKRLNMLLSFLIEREKIVQGKDGFYLHSRWLEEIVSKIKKLGKRELTVSDFKRITGLTRKYAIPLLELLDQMGVTRRRDPSHREIL